MSTAKAYDHEQHFTRRELLGMPIGDLVTVSSCTGGFPLSCERCEPLIESALNQRVGEWLTCTPRECSVNDPFAELSVVSRFVWK
jgi:hypothetical protein